MGCSWFKPKSEKGNGDIYKGGMKLSDHEKQLIKKSWAQLEKDMDNIGVRIFLRIFDQNPSVKRMFPFRDHWGDALIKDPMFQAHARR